MVLRAFSDAVSSCTRGLSGVLGLGAPSSEMPPREPRCARSSFNSPCSKLEVGLIKVGVPHSDVPRLLSDPFHMAHDSRKSYYYTVGEVSGHHLAQVIDL